MLINGANGITVHIDAFKSWQEIWNFETKDREISKCGASDDWKSSGYDGPVGHSYRYQLHDPLGLFPASDCSRRCCRQSRRAARFGDDGVELAKGAEAIEWP